MPATDLSVKLKQLPQCSSLFPPFLILFSRDQQIQNHHGNTGACTVTLCTDEFPWEKFALKSFRLEFLATIPSVLEKRDRQGKGELPLAVGQEIPEWVSPGLLPCVFVVLRMTKCCLSYLPIKLLGRTSDAQEWPSENKQESCRVEIENLMLSTGLREGRTSNKWDRSKIGFCCQVC